jgi:WD40 repeat protein
MRDSDARLGGRCDCLVRVWDPAAGRCLAVLPGHTNWINSLAHAAATMSAGGGGNGCNGGRLLSGSGDQTIRVWVEDYGRHLAATGGVSNDGGGVAGGPGEQQAGGGGAGAWQCERVLAGHAGLVNCLADCGLGRLASGSEIGNFTPPHLHSSPSPTLYLLCF